MVTTKKRVVAVFLLVFFMVMSLMPSASLAAPKEDEADAVASKSQLTNVTAKYLNGIGGTEIVNPESYSVSAKEQDPQEIEGWVYKDYKEAVDYVYVPKDIPYIVGYPDDTVRPLRYLTRAEAAAIFSRLYDGDYPKQVKKYKDGKTFKDVSEKHWAHDEIAKLYECGIISGDDNKFYPDTPISRAELAALAVRFNPDKFTTDGDGDSPFKDVADGKWYEDVITLAAANEWVSGYPDKTFRPENNVTRTETMAIINRVLQRQITSERLNEVGASNPYTDIKSTDWYYADAIEATVKHETEEWHEIDYNNGAYNVIDEKYVDEEGNEIAEATESKGKKVDEPRSIPGFKYLGYVKHSTYIYEKGQADPSITKSSDAQGKDGKKLVPGDIVNYTISVSNSKDATRWIENATVTDTIPEYLTLVDGSVTVDSQTVDYGITTAPQDKKDDKDSKGSVDTIKVTVGDVGIGQTKVVKFACTVDKDAYNKKIENLAILKGDNIEDKEAKDDGFTVLEGKAYLAIDKSVDKTEAKVGDTLTYTVEVTNDRTSENKAKGVTITDVLDEHLNFEGNVFVGKNSTRQYTFDKETNTLTVKLGQLEKGKSKVVSFDVSVKGDAFDTVIDNVATAKAKNADPVTDNAESVTVAEGSADLSIEKEVNETKVEVGDELYYTIKVNNNKNAETTAHNVVVHDVLPEQLDFRGQVTLNGESANYNWNPETRQLDVKVGGLNPGEEAEIIIYGTIGSKAYGEEINNIAQVTSDNADPKEDEAKTVTVKDGDPDGNISTKVASVSTAKPGDTYHYTITAKNSPNATADWEISISDPLPDEVEYLRTEVNGKQATDVSYDEKTHTLTLTPDPLKPNETAQWEIFVKVKEGTDGKQINNVAILTDKDGDKEIPANPVDVPEVPVTPYVSKTHDVDSVGDMESVVYTVVVQNSSKEGIWKNVMVSDVLPAEVQLLGDPTVNGVGNLDYSRNGNNVYIYLGDLDPGERAEIKYEVMVKKGTQKTIHVKEGEDPTEDQIRDNTVWLRNVVTADGNNGSNGATDDKVQVPPVIVEDPAEEPSEPEYPTDPGEPWAEKLSEKEIVDLNADKNNVYTIKLHNDSKEVWKNVKFNDELFTKRLHLYMDSVKVNGVKKNWGSDYVYTTDKTNYKDNLYIPIGDIKPGQTVTVEFEVRFENDMADYTYTNIANITSDNFDPLNPEAPTVIFTNPQAVSGIHNRLFSGYSDGTWHPGIEDQDDIYYLSLEEAACVISRATTAEWRGKATGGKDPHDMSISLPAGFPTDEWYAVNVRFMGMIGALEVSDVSYDPQYNTKGEDYLIKTRMIATREQLGRMLKTCSFGGSLTPGTDYQTTDPSKRTSRGAFASEMCSILSRDKNPDTNGCEVFSFSDAIGNGVVTETSIWHNYVLNGYSNDEIWTVSDKSKGVELDIR